MKKVFIVFSLILSVSAIDAKVEAKTFDYLKSKIDVDRANRLYKKGDYENSIALYEQALSKNSNSYQIYNNLALAKYANGDKEEARELFDRAKGIISTNDKKTDISDLYYNSGVLNAANKDYRKAVDDLIYSLSLNSKDDRAREAIEYSRKRLKEEENKNNGKSDNKDEKENSDNKDDNNKDGNNNDDEKNNKDNNKENSKENSEDKKNDDNNPDEKNSLRDLEIEQLLNSLRNLRKDDNYKEERLGNGYNSEKDW